MLAQLAEGVLGRRTSAVDLVRESFARIERDNPRLNAVVRLRPDAVADAEALDRRIAAGGVSSGELPLAGIPFLVKDVEDLAGLPTTHGSLLFADAPAATTDSGTVTRLRAAGAIPVGKANTSEFAFEGVAENRLFGRTLNPWNTDWSPGGSSGGSAAAIAAGFIPIATATDAGGSARGPAALCGLVGLKPTNGLIGRAAAPLWLDLVTDGVLGTSVADVALLLSVMAGPQPGDVSAAMSWAPDRESLPGRLLVTPRLQSGGALPDDVRAAFEAAIPVLASALRLTPEWIEPASIFPGAHHPDDDSLLILEPETVQWLGRERLLRDRARLDPFFERYLDAALAVTLDDYVAARRRRFDHTRALDTLLGRDAILVTPTNNTGGLLADGTPAGGGTNENAGANTNPHNVAGHPAVSVPAGMLPTGLPFGILLTAPRYRDDLLLNAAARWEAVAPWPLSAPGYTPFGV